MTRTADAAVVHEFRRPRVTYEVAIPTLDSREALIESAAHGVCHTDLHAGESDWLVEAIIPCLRRHEGAGVVAALRLRVKPGKQGDPVDLAWLNESCGDCESCRTGWDAPCVGNLDDDYSEDGSNRVRRRTEVDFRIRPSPLQKINDVDRLSAGEIYGLSYATAASDPEIGYCVVFGRDPAVKQIDMRRL